MDFKLSQLAVETACNAVTTLLNAGFLRLFDGDKLLAEMRFADPAFSPSVDGSASALPLQPDRQVRATGKPNRFVAVGPDGMSVIWQGTIGKPKSPVFIKDSELRENGEVSVTSMVYTHPKET